MGVPFELEVHPTYLHFKLLENCRVSAESDSDTWITVARLCEEHGRAKVLIEVQRVEGKMDTMSAFESGRILAENATGVTLAICVHEPDFDETASFFKTVAQNRGVKVEFFSGLDSARQWLNVDTGESATRSG